MRQHEIEDEDIRWPRPNRRQRVASIREKFSGEARLLQIMCDELTDIWIVLDDEHAGHWRIL